MGLEDLLPELVNARNGQESQFRAVEAGLRQAYDKAEKVLKTDDGGFDYHLLDNEEIFNTYEKAFIDGLGDFAAKFMKKNFSRDNRSEIFKDSLRSLLIRGVFGLTPQDFSGILSKYGKNITLPDLYKESSQGLATTRQMLLDEANNILRLDPVYNPQRPDDKKKVIQGVSLDPRKVTNWEMLNRQVLGNLINLYEQSGKVIPLDTLKNSTWYRA